MHGEQAKLAAALDCIEKINALMAAAYNDEPDKRLEALAQEAAHAYVLCVTAGTTYTGFDEQSAYALATFQVITKGALHIAAKEVRLLRNVDF